MSDWAGVKRYTIRDSHRYAFESSGGIWCRVVDAFAAEATARAEGYAQGLEDAAKECEAKVWQGNPAVWAGAEACAAAIRALKEKGE